MQPWWDGAGVWTVTDPHTHKDFTLDALWRSGSVCCTAWDKHLVAKWEWTWEAANQRNQMLQKSAWIPPRYARQHWAFYFSPPAYFGGCDVIYFPPQLSNKDNLVSVGEKHFCYCTFVSGENLSISCAVLTPNGLFSWWPDGGSRERLKYCGRLSHTCLNNEPSFLLL